eukprot:scaffold11461_cov58-Cyclotella_meneghiniana.AAC.6
MEGKNGGNVNRGGSEEIREKQKDELDEYRWYYASAVRNVLNEQPGMTASTIDRIIEDVSRKFSLSLNERNSQQIYG